MKKFISLWRITQVRLKGTVLKTVRRVKARKGSNPLSSFSGLRPLYCHGCWRFSDSTDMIHLSESSQCFLIIIAGWSSWQLAGLITRRSQVQVLSPQLVLIFFLVYLWSVGQAVKTPPFHGGNTGSIPVRIIIEKHSSECFFLIIGKA